MAREPVTHGRRRSRARGKIPLLSRFFATRGKADVLFTASAPVFMRGQVWGHYIPMYQAILAGKSVDEAMKIYVTEQRKAAAAFRNA